MPINTRIERYGRAIALAIDEDYMEDYKQYNRQAAAVLTIADEEIATARSLNIASQPTTDRTAPGAVPATVPGFASPVGEPWDEYDPDDDYEDDEEDREADCGRWINGRLSPQCRLAGSEWCDWDCPIGIPSRGGRRVLSRATEQGAGDAGRDGEEG